mgnify:CR=1 FL=1
MLQVMHGLNPMIGSGPPTVSTETRGKVTIHDPSNLPRLTPEAFDAMFPGKEAHKGKGVRALPERRRK